MTWTKVFLSLALLVASASSNPLLRSGLADLKSISSRVDDDYRLPNDTVPISYVVNLNPKLEVDDFTIDGTTAITLQVVTPTSSITLHTNAITYNESLTTLTNAAGVAQTITSHTYDTDLHFLIIGTQNLLPVGNYTLSFTFVAILDNDMAGFYRSSYTDDSGNTVWLATTQFESTSARRAFPCYDEPALKATFSIGLKHYPDYHALSNMPIMSQVDDTSDGKTWTYFEETPLMSTYLLAFIVSDFDSIKNEDETFNVWSSPNAIHLAQYAHDIGIVELATMEEFVGVNYTLPKMDQISIPDFSAGAMENWGLVTYRETYFHYDENETTLTRKQSIASVISHEFGHQWFGNLVSPAWWKYLWLNEGFATYFEYMATELSEDNWRMMDQMVVKAQQALAFAADALATSHPMNQDVSSPAEISSIFDNISYAKAGCILRMISHFLTEEVFRNGLTKYLTANAFSSVTSDELFEALQEADDEASILPSHVYVATVMDTWVNQMGYPVVTVTRNYTTGTTVFSQQRFLLGEADATDTNDYKWWIPINWATESSPDFNSTVAQDWIRAQDPSVVTNSISATGGWIIVNKQQTGFYRVNYDETNWQLLSDYLESDDYLNIHVLNRAALIDDALNLARANLLSYSTVFDLSFYLRREVDYIPWYAAFTGISYINQCLANTENYEEFRAYLVYLTQAVWDSVGIDETDNDDHVTKLHRSNVINYACAYGLQSCRSSAEAKVALWLDDSTANPISPTLLTNTICAGLRGANSTTWNKALSTCLLTTTSSTDKTALLAGLGCSEDSAIITNWLSTIITSTSGLTTTEARSAFIGVYQGSTYNVEIALDFLVSNVTDVIDYLGSSALTTFATGISSRLTTTSQSTKLTDFLATQTSVISESSITSALSNVASNIAWSTEYEDDITEWVSSKLVEITAEDSTTTTTDSNDDTTTTTTTSDPNEDVTTTTEDPNEDVTTTTEDPNEDVTTTTEDPNEDVTTTTEDPNAASTAFLSAVTALSTFLVILMTQ